MFISSVNGQKLREFDVVRAPVPIPMEIAPKSWASRVFVPTVSAPVVDIPASTTSEVPIVVRSFWLLPVSTARVPPDPATDHERAAVILNASSPAAVAATLAPAPIAQRVTAAKRLASGQRNWKISEFAASAAAIVPEVIESL